MGHNSNNPVNAGNAEEKIEELHTADEIIHHAKELLAKQMGLDLHSFAGLEEMEVREADGDSIYFVDDSGKRVEFTEELQLKAAIAVLNSNENYFFEATPMGEGAMGEIRKI